MKANCNYCAAYCKHRHYDSRQRVCRNFEYSEIKEKEFKSRKILCGKHKWNEKEILLLKSKYPSSTSIEKKKMAEELGVSLESIRIKANRMGVKTEQNIWNDKRISEFIEKSKECTNVKQLAQEMGMSRNMIVKKANECKIHVNKNKFIWTKDKLAELERDYNHIKDIKEIANKYGYTVNNLKGILTYYQIKRGRKFCGQWSKEEEMILIEKYNEVNNISTLAKLLGRSVNAIHTKAYKLNIRRHKK